ncbi:MAG: DUF111 family protein, partial [Gemmatimonadota bacterium]
ALFQHSTTAGLRHWQAERNTLKRNELTVLLDDAGSVRVKVLEGAGGVRVKPEYGDVLELAAAMGLPALQVARMAQRRAETILGEKGYKLL